MSGVVFFLASLTGLAAVSLSAFVFFPFTGVLRGIFPLFDPER